MDMAFPAFSSCRSILRSVPPLVAALLILSVMGMNLPTNKSIGNGEMLKPDFIR